MALSVTGAGMVTSLGFGFSGSCAGLRAGVALPRELDFEVDEGGGEIARAVGYPASPIADGFSQAGAWVCLASSASADLRYAAGLPTDADLEFWQRTGLACALPLIDLDRFGWRLDQAPQRAESAFLRPTVEGSLPRIAGARHWQALGHVGTASVLALCAQARQAERAVILAADSFLDHSTLRWLTDAARLKSPGRPTGLMPGEAGAALLVESDQSARQRKARVLGTVEAVALGSIGPGHPQPHDEDPDEPPPMPPAAALGRALADTIRQALPTHGKLSRFCGDLYLDLNGEDWRAAAWGHAQVHLSRAIDFDRCRTFLPAESLGETGAASGAIGVGLALYNLEQDRTGSALVISLSENGAVSAVRLHAPAS